MTIQAPECSGAIAHAAIDLIPVIAGAILGLVSGLIGARYTSNLSTKKEHADRQQERLQKLVAAAYELEMWLKKEEAYILFRGPDNLELSPLAQIETIALLHLPMLKPQSDALSLSVQTYRLKMFEIRQQTDSENHRGMTPQERASVLDLYEPLLVSKNALLRSAEAQMRSLLVS